MATTIPQPSTNTYHCICTNLLLTTTHTLNSLPRRSTASSTDTAIILPLPAQPSTSAGYTQLLSLLPDPRSQPAILRLPSGGFEKRILHRCARCRVPVAYEIVGSEDTDMGDGETEEKDEEEYNGRVIYLLPRGLMSTEFMTSMSGEKGRKINEVELAISGGGGIAVFD